MYMLYYDTSLLLNTFDAAFWVHHIIDVYMLICRSDKLSFKVKLTESQRSLILKAAFNEDDRPNDPFRLSNYETYYGERFVQWILTT